MKSRFFKTLLLSAVIVGGIWILINRDSIRNPSDILRLVKQRFASFSLGITTTSKKPSNEEPGLPTQQTPQFVTNVIRIATFKLNNSIHKTDSAMEVLADICLRYDGVVFQGIDANEDTWLARLTDRMNTVDSAAASNLQPMARNQSDYFFVSERSFDRGQAVQSPSGQSVIGQSAIVFNRRTLQLDQLQGYNVNDPDGVLSHAPFVVCFRTRGPAINQAFTFSLVSLNIDGNRPKRELAYLGEIFRAICEDGRGEDDVLIVGDFNTGDGSFQPILTQASLTSVVSNLQTNSLNASPFDNFVFNELASVEFTGRSGVFDFMRHYNMRLDEALQNLETKCLCGRSFPFSKVSLRVCPETNLTDQAKLFGSPPRGLFSRSARATNFDAN